ncbi:hypothetical protein [Xanthomonas arboricola]|uniref:hypothetical protein n=1 Tax=Xanthomonas arboricola TaxID=56448 RepID=UPI000CEED1FD|nr:hypothetical protein [Xanthomonas arboricola]MBB6573533.1 uncharacterized coiled-coil DUF342 family protein [Xanthomonas arboricola]PPT88887.1 hypothetical protein XarbCFBP8149_07260 [Xanthomonas arboricola]
MDELEELQDELAAIDLQGLPLDVEGELKGISDAIGEEIDRHRAAGHVPPEAIGAIAIAIAKLRAAVLAAKLRMALEAWLKWLRAEADAIHQDASLRDRLADIARKIEELERQLAKVREVEEQCRAAANNALGKIPGPEPRIPKPRGFK